jgi:hypothetical protein
LPAAVDDMRRRVLISTFEVGRWTFDVQAFL